MTSDTRAAMNELCPLKNWLELGREDRGKNALLEVQVTVLWSKSLLLAGVSAHQEPLCHYENRKRKSISLSHSFPAEHLRPGTIYETTSEALPPVVPADVALLRVVMLFDVKGMQAILKYPSAQSLRAFFGKNAEKISSLGTSCPKLQEAIMGTFPDLDKTFIFPASTARTVLGRPIPCTELLHQGHLKSFWVADGDPNHWLSASSCSMPRHRAPEVGRETGLLKIPKDLRARWSSERYESCQLKLFQIMKDKGAKPGKTIPRSVLREDARKHIGDTGLLDHLLKHMTDHVIADNQRFRRQHNSQGVMEYWIEDAGLMEIRKKAGMQDSAWVPPPGWKPGDAVIAQQGYSGMNAAEKATMNELVQEVQRLKSDLQLLSTNGRFHKPEVPTESETEEAELKKEMRNQLKSLKANIEELQAAYLEMQQGSHTSPPTFCESRNSINTERAMQRLEKLEHQVHRLAEGHIQLTNLWKAIMALQENMASLAAAIQPAQSSS